jgi:hypothetical protein
MGVKLSWYPPHNNCDESECICPNEDLELSFTVEGGVFLAMGSGDPAGCQNYAQPKGKTWRGRIMAVAQASESPEMIVSASCSELPSSQVKIAAV